MIILRQNNFSASIPGQLKKIQKLEGIYAMNINQGHNPLSKEMSDLAYKITREKDVYRQKFRKKVGLNRDIENNFYKEFNNRVVDDNKLQKIRTAQNKIELAENKLRNKGHKHSKNQLNEQQVKQLRSSLNAHKQRSTTDFLGDVDSFDHYFHRDSKKISSMGKKVIEDQIPHYYRGTHTELSSPEYYKNQLGFNDNLSNQLAKEVPNSTDSLTVYNHPQTKEPLYGFHNKRHKFDQAVVDSHEYGHIIAKDGHHPEHLIKEKAANAEAMNIAKRSGASLQSSNEMARILDKQRKLTEEFDIIENYNGYGRL